MSDPYHALGLTRNPFCVDPAPGVAQELFLNRPFPDIPAAGRRRFVQVIGPKGAGKTTLLLHWRRNAHAPYRHVPPGIVRWMPLPIAPLVYWDEADRVPGGLLHPALAACRLLNATVVAGTHEDLSAAAVRWGFSVETFELPVIRPEEVLRWAEARIEDCSLESGSSGLKLDYGEACRVARDAYRSWRRVGGLLHRWSAKQAAIVKRPVGGYT